MTKIQGAPTGPLVFKPGQCWRVGDAGAFRHVAHVDDAGVWFHLVRGGGRHPEALRCATVASFQAWVNRGAWLKSGPLPYVTEGA